MSDEKNNPRSFTTRAIIFSAVFTGVSLLLMIVAGPGHRAGIDFRSALQIFRIGAYAGMIGLGFGLFALLRGFSFFSRAQKINSSLSIFVSLIIVGVYIGGQMTAATVPRIHDITTDLEQPPQFKSILPLRADAPNSAEYGGPEIAEQQRKAYPEVQPLSLPLPVPLAYQLALYSAKKMGWELVGQDPAMGHIEAVATTSWFGFKDDVVVRISEDGGGSRVDVRSVSRVGLSDLGTNAKRIRKYLEHMKTTLEKNPLPNK